MKLITTIFLIFSITGCASNSANTARSASSAKTIPFSQYKAVAQELYNYELCALFGMSDPQLATEGQEYIIKNGLGNNFNGTALNHHIIIAKRELEPMLIAFGDDLDKYRRNELEDSEKRRGLQSVQQGCRARDMATLRERNRREENRARYEHQARAMNEMANTLSNMGNMAYNAGRASLQMTQPAPIYTQPSTGHTNRQSNGSGNYLINTPNGLVRKSCISAGSSYSYCF